MQENVAPVLIKTKIVGPQLAGRAIIHKDCFNDLNGSGYIRFFNVITDSEDCLFSKHFDVFFFSTIMIV